METPVLEGRFVRLARLEPEHLDALFALAQDRTIWKYMLMNLSTREALEAWAEKGWADEAAGTTLPWVSLAKQPDGGWKVAGATRFNDLDLRNRSVEIGNTWIGEAARGTLLNKEAKYLQMKFAFETLGLERVALKAHANNLRSQTAIRSIGGVYEGTFRHHLLMPDGSYRDSAWFSILKTQWPEVKEDLERRMRTEG